VKPNRTGGARIRDWRNPRWGRIVLGFALATTVSGCLAAQDAISEDQAGAVAIGVFVVSVAAIGALWGMADWARGGCSLVRDRGSAVHPSTLLFEFALGAFFQWQKEEPSAPGESGRDEGAGKRSTGQGNRDSARRPRGDD